MPANKELAAFVEYGLRQGITRAELDAGLRRAGWNAEQVRNALDMFADFDFPVPVPRPRANVSARETFLYVVMFTTLLFAAYNVGDLLFSLIDRAFPDPAETSRPYLLQSIRWALSAVIVSFPIFAFVAWLIGRSLRASEFHPASRVRRQCTYITLFIASVVLVGDLTTLLYNFLGGEVTLRFVLKAVTVAVIAGGIFAYYLADLRAVNREPEV